MSYPWGYSGTKNPTAKQRTRNQPPECKFSPVPGSYSRICSPGERESGSQKVLKRRLAAGLYSDLASRELDSSKLTVYRAARSNFAGSCQKPTDLSELDRKRLVLQVLVPRAQLEAELENPKQ